MCSERAPRLTLIIPCHNTGSLVPRCFKSLEPLSDEGVEILVIDDCSTDDTAAVIAATLESMPRLRRVTTFIKNESNLGLASTRALGITRANGSYILHIDSDDFIDAAALTEALALAEATDADCVVSPFTEIRDGKEKTRNPGTLEDLNSLKIDYVNFSLCNKLLKSRLISSNMLLQYPGLDRWEDLGVTSRILALRPQIEYFPSPWYNYTIDSSRTTLSSFNREATVSGRVAVARMTAEWFAERKLDREYEPFLLAMKFYAKANYLRGSHKDFAAWKSTFPEVNSRIMSLSQIPLFWRLAFKAVSIVI